MKVQKYRIWISDFEKDKMLASFWVKTLFKRQSQNYYMFAFQAKVITHITQKVVQGELTTYVETNENYLCKADVNLNILS